MAKSTAVLPFIKILFFLARRAKMAVILRIVMVKRLPGIAFIHAPVVQTSSECYLY